MCVLAAKGCGVDHRRMRRVVIVAFDGAQSLDVTGPAEAFSIATRFFGGDYAIELVTPDGAPARCTSGLSLNADGSIDEVRGAIDTLVVAGGAGVRRGAPSDERSSRWIARGRARARAAWPRSARARSCSPRPACSTAGARRRTGRAATGSRERYPRSRSSPTRSSCATATSATSAGVTAGMDLALALVEEDLGREVALDVARWLVLFLAPPRRPVPVQRPARRAGRRARAAARAAGAHRRAPRRATSRCRRSPRART